MPYSDGNTPALGDKVRYRDGRTGTVTYIHLKAAHRSGHDVVGVAKFDGGGPGLGDALAQEYVLISRSKLNTQILERIRKRASDGAKSIPEREALALASDKFFAELFNRQPPPYELTEEEQAKLTDAELDEAIENALGPEWK